MPLRDRFIIWNDRERHEVEFASKQALSPASIDLLDELRRLFRRSVRRHTEVTLVLPRSGYAFKKLAVPRLPDGELQSVIRNHIELGLQFTAGEAYYFAYVPIENDSIVSGDQQEVAIYYSLESSVQPWIQSLDRSGLKLARIIAQSQWIAASTAKHPSNEKQLVLFSTRFETECVVVSRGTAGSSILLERAENGAFNREEFEFELLHYRDRWLQSLDVRQIRIEGEYRSEILDLVVEHFPGLPCESQGVSIDELAIEPIYRRSSGSHLLAGFVSSRVPEADVITGGRRRFRWFAASILILLLPLLALDLQNRYVARQKTELQALLAKNDDLLSKSEEVREKYLAVEQKMPQRRDWLADLDAICRAIQEENDIFLGPLSGEFIGDNSEAVVHVTGIAENSQIVSDLLIRYGDDRENRKVSPLALGPQVSDGKEVVRFEIELTRDAAGNQGRKE